MFRIRRCVYGQLTIEPWSCRTIRCWEWHIENHGNLMGISGTGMKDAKKRNLKAGTLAPICSPSIKWTKESGSRWVQRPPTQHSVFLASLTAQCYPVFKRETETERGGRLWRRGRNKLRKMGASGLRKKSAQDWPGRRKQQSVQPAIYGPHVTQNIYECVPAQNKPWVHM